MDHHEHSDHEMPAPAAADGQVGQARAGHDMAAAGRDGPRQVLIACA